MIRETEEEIVKINSSLRKVNEIYRDLAVIVTQQGEQLEQIEESTQLAHQQAQNGLQQVEKARQSQGSCNVS